MPQADPLIEAVYEGDHNKKFVVSLHYLTAQNGGGWALYDPLMYDPPLTPWPYSNQWLRHVQVRLRTGEYRRYPCGSDQSSQYITGGAYLFWENGEQITGYVLSRTGEKWRPQDL